MLTRSFSVGPLTVHLYGVIIATAIFAGWYIAKKRAHLYKIPQSLFDDPILLLPLVLGIIGARAYHVADYWDFYVQNPLSIINISAGGLGIWGALAAIFIGFALVAKVKRINLLSLLDLASPSILLGQAIGRIGNFVNQEAFGPPTDLPWAVFISPENRPAQFAQAAHFHPTFFYEAILDLIFFIALLYFSKLSTVNRQLSTKPGQIFALYLILYSIGRFIVEFFRIDTATIGTIKLAHLLSILTLAIGLLLLNKLRAKI